MSATNRGSDRNRCDFYATPIEAFKPLLLSVLPDDVEFHDPCCGDGRLIVWLGPMRRKTAGADLYPRKEWPCEKVNFLKDTTPRDFIVTNPPFSRAQEFVAHGLKHSREMMLLLRLNFLGSQKRRAWWKDREPSALFVLSERPDFTGGGGDATEYAWFYWGRRFQGIRHL